MALKKQLTEEFILFEKILEIANTNYNFNTQDLLDNLNTLKLYYDLFKGTEKDFNSTLQQIEIILLNLTNMQIDIKKYEALNKNYITSIFIKSISNYNSKIKDYIYEANIYLKKNWASQKDIPTAFAQAEKEIKNYIKEYGEIINWHLIDPHIKYNKSRPELEEPYTTAYIKIKGINRILKTVHINLLIKEYRNLLLLNVIEAQINDTHALDYYKIRLEIYRSFKLDYIIKNTNLNIKLTNLYLQWIALKKKKYIYKTAFTDFKNYIEFLLDIKKKYKNILRFQNLKESLTTFKHTRPNHNFDIDWLKEEQYLKEKIEKTKELKKKQEEDFLLKQQKKEKKRLQKAKHDKTKKDEEKEHKKKIERWMKEKERLRVSRLQEMKILQKAQKLKKALKMKRSNKKYRWFKDRKDY